MTIPSKKNIPAPIKWLILCYILTLPITNLEIFPWENKIQVPELIFTLLFVTIVLQRAWYLFKIKNKTFTLGVVLYLGAGVLSFFLNQEKEILIELVKVGYLFLACIIISNYLIEHNQDGYQELINFMLNGGVLLSIGSILAWIYATIIDSSIFLVDFYEDYPIIGDTCRAKFLTFTPTMFALFLCVCIFFLVEKLQENSSIKNILSILVCFMALILTFSKTNLLLLPILCILYVYYYRPRNTYVKLASLGFFIGCLVVFNILSHFSFLNKKETIELKNTKYLSGEKVLELENYVIVKNSYLLLKEEAIVAFKQSPIVGIGLGRFDNYLDQQKQKEEYAEQLISYDPHSTYFGVLAELGLLGGIALTIIMLSVLKMMKRKREYLPLLGILLLFVCEGMVTDMMNVRHLWLVFSLLIYLQFRV